jgi:predicted carbohydrate-binding protein with CBM5 and CBM33 domain
MLVRPRLVRSRSVQPSRGRLIAAGIAAPLLMVAAAGAAAAHGAPVDPVSRAAACGSQGRFTQTAACQAARAGAEGQWFEQWDNVRVADVAGRDRQTIPDGHLCSGGIDNFGGLDLARSDWPTTKLRAGKAITVSYRGTIPHQGTFRMYVTKDGYNPKQALRWADLQSTPFLTAKDPNFAGGAYTFKGTLPSGKTGRHILYTVWQNSSTADTYYSCSDVDFGKAAKATVTTAPAASTKRAASPKRRSTPKPTVTTGAAATSAAVTTEPTANGAVTLGAAKNLSSDVSGEAAGNSLLIPALAGIGLLVLAGTGGATALVRRRRRAGPRRH